MIQYQILTEDVVKSYFHNNYRSSRKIISIINYPEFNIGFVFTKSEESDNFVQGYEWSEKNVVGFSRFYLTELSWIRYSKVFAKFKKKFGLSKSIKFDEETLRNNSESLRLELHKESISQKFIEKQDKNRLEIEHMQRSIARLENENKELSLRCSLVGGEKDQETQYAILQKTIHHQNG